MPAPDGAYDGADCDARYAPWPDRDPSPMCFAPGGTFDMGAPDGQSEPEDRPRHRVTLSPFFVDLYEVTMAQYAAFLASPEARAIGCELLIPTACPEQNARPGVRYDVDTPPKGTATSATATFRVPPGLEQDPATDMSFRGAVAYCAWAGKALPTEAQWEYAAAHDPRTGKSHAFPWGDQFEPQRSNCDEALCKDGFKGPAPVGSFYGAVGRKDGRSPIGIHDAHGNVYEWVSSCIRGPYEDCGECRDPAPELECVRPEVLSRRGGDPYAFAGDEPTTMWRRLRTGISGGVDVLGFRCITAAAPPATGAVRTPLR